MQLLRSFLYAIAVGWIHNEDDSLTIGVIMMPESAYASLASNIPNGHP